MRQVGIIAAAGIVALESGVDRLAEDHANAQLLAQGLAAMSGIFVDLDTVQTNMVNFDVARLAVTPEQFIARLAERGVLVAGNGGSVIRAVTSYEVSRGDIEYALSAISELVRDVSPAVA